MNSGDLCQDHVNMNCDLPPPPIKPGLLKKHWGRNTKVGFSISDSSKFMSLQMKLTQDSEDENRQYSCSSCDVSM